MNHDDFPEVRAAVAAIGEHVIAVTESPLFLSTVDRAGRPNKGNNMVELTLAHCPKCGETPSIFIRSRDEDDLVCNLCREGGSSPNVASPPPSRRSLTRIT